jgi:tRNA threonylcarbamoyl adenosine modification protein (Sua5/YciO/YrdC/YwlC family)
MHPTNPQPRVVKMVAEQLKKGLIIAYPTDSTYALGCLPDARNALEKIRDFKKLSTGHPLTMVCSDIAQVGRYAVMDNNSFKFVKSYTPGPYTFVLPALKSVPRPAQGIKRRNIGVRIPDNAIVHALLDELGSPILSTTLWVPGMDEPISDPECLSDHVGKCVNLIVDGGIVENKPTTVIDLTSSVPEILRQGSGNVDF